MVPEQLLIIRPFQQAEQLRQPRSKLRVHPAWSPPVAVTAVRVLILGISQFGFRGIAPGAGTGACPAGARLASYGERGEVFPRYHEDRRFYWRSTKAA